MFNFKTMRKHLVTVSLLLTSLFTNAYALNNNSDFNNGWKFTLSDSACYSFVNYNPSSWKTVNLPHDWSVDLPFESTAEGCTGFLKGGIGWYSKTFDTPDNFVDKKCYIVFDGVYNNSEYWINGRKLGFHPYGYSPFFYDISDYLNPKGQENRISVRIDHSRYADSRWYTGSGIYRETQLIFTDKLHIPVWGTFVTTPVVSSERATVNIEVRVKNDYSGPRAGEVRTSYFDSKNKKVGEKLTSFLIEAGKEMKINQSVEISNPSLWDVDSPSMYLAKSEILVDGNVVDTKETPFGIRSIKFDAKKGFFLNGKNMKIKGVCLHHDASMIGAALVEDVWRRRLQTLKDGGCNAIRLSHNPGADAFLELCDEMGFLVQEEFFDEWDYPKDKRLNMDEQSIDYITRGYCEYFQEWAERDLKNVMLRSRNHPCIFQWSIGNEIEWTYKGCKESTGFFSADAGGGYFWNQPPYSTQRIREEWAKQPKQTYDIGRTAKKLAAWTREMDTTRPVTANCILPSISYETGYIDALDVAGFRYRRVMYDYAHKNYPDKPAMGTENLGQWHEWKAVIERDYIPGMFIWTGVDYLGEVGTKGREWPQRAIGCGLLDLAGFEKPSFHMMKSLWTDAPFIAIYSQTANKSSYVEKDGKFTDKDPKKPWTQRLWVWEDVNSHWNYTKGEKVVVEIYSNCDEIELFQNGKSLGKRFLKDFEDHIYKWSVDFKDGNIVAKGKKNGKKTTSAIYTTKETNSIKLSVDKVAVDANNTDVIHVTAQLIDRNGRNISWEEKEITFNIGGNYRLLGVENGDHLNVLNYKSNTVKTYKGRALLVLQATDKAGILIINANSGSISSNDLKVEVK